MSIRWSEEDFARYQGKKGKKPGPKPNGLKYHNHRVQWQGEEFDSKRELDTYHALEAARVAGQFRAVVRQVSMRLPGTKRRMRIDFMVVEPNGSIRWLDAKGYATPEWKLKRDQVEQAYGISIETV